MSVLPHRTASSKQSRLSGFSLVEVMVACSVLGAMLVVMLSTVNHVSELWRTSNARVEAFQSARLGFENLTRLLGQATLNTYWDYDDPNNPTRYIRKSELHFFVDEAEAVLGTGSFYGQGVFFQAPANHNPPAANAGISFANRLPGLLNACGFYVECASESEKGWLPTHVDSQGKKRFRLMQWMQRSGDLSVYQTVAGSTGRDWTALSAQAIPAADNVIALVIAPKEPEHQSVKALPDQYNYDSRENTGSNPQPANANQLPPILQVAMVAIDEASANRLGDAMQSTIESCLSGLFKETPGASFESDMKTLEEALTAQRINYRVFVSAIPMHEAKWAPEP